MKYLLLILLAVGLHAEVKPCEKGKKENLSTCETEKWQRLGFQLQNIETQFKSMQAQLQQVAQPIAAEQKSMQEEICKRADIELAKCSVDVQNGKAVKLPDPPKGITNAPPTATPLPNTP